MRTIRIGSGAGFSNDRVEPGIELLEKGQLDYFCLECLAERTIAIAQKEKNLDPNIGYNPYLAYRMKKILPIAAEKHVPAGIHVDLREYEETFKKMDKIDFKVILPGHDMKVLEHSVYPY